MKSFIQICILLSGVALFAYGRSTKDKHQHRILNGQDVEITNAKFFCLLQCNGNFCGSAIVRLNKVVTSAECVAHCAVEQIVISCGFNDVNEFDGAQHYSASAKWIPSQYATNHTMYNIAVIQTSTNIATNNNVGTIDYANSVPANGSNVQVYGYGYTQTGSFPQKLQTTQMPIVHVEDNVFITDATTSSAFVGDGGGPAVQNGKLVGVVSDIAADPSDIFQTYLNLFTSTGSSEIYSFLQTHAQ